eukprot:14292597-Ditylum_brightwellii.AAC.1
MRRTSNESMKLNIPSLIILSCAFIAATAATAATAFVPPTTTTTSAPALVTRFNTDRHSVRPLSLSSRSSPFSPTRINENWGRSIKPRTCLGASPNGISNEEKDNVIETTAAEQSGSV